MAYQARGRDPLLDSTTQAAIEKRGKELIGIALIVLGLMAAQGLVMVLRSILYLSGRGAAPEPQEH